MVVHSRFTTLANGDAVPLWNARHWFEKLESYQKVQDAEWDVVYHLRELCLGRTLEEEQIRSLAHEGFLSAEGAVDPVLRSVVLSSVRGEGRLLRLDPPYTDEVDRRIADYLSAQNILPSHLSNEEMEELRGADMDRLLKEVREDVLDNLQSPPVDDHVLREFRRRLRKNNPDGSPQGPGGGTPGN